LGSPQIIIDTPMSKNVSRLSLWQLRAAKVF